MFDLHKDTQNSPVSLAQCCAKPEKAMQGIAGQEWASRLSINIELRVKKCKNHHPGHWLSPKFKKNNWKMIFIGLVSVFWKNGLSLREDYKGIFVS